jgi:hypothetical protein
LRADQPSDRSERVDLPEYTYDVHTRKERIAGKMKVQFFSEEQDALLLKVSGLFDNLN